jgi:transposase
VAPPPGPGSRARSPPASGPIEPPLAQIDAALARQGAPEDARSRQLALLGRRPGVGPGVGDTTARSRLLDMPELGTLEGKQAARLAGLAPISRPSGTGHGRERLQGGRPLLRRAITRPAWVAPRVTADLTANYEPLTRAGTPAKVALTATRRKRVVMANALLRDGREWSQTRP